MKMEMVAKIIHLESGNLVFKFDNELDTTKFNRLKSKCEICNTVRYRKETFIIKDDNNKLIQVGSDCINKVLGTLNDKAYLLINATQADYDNFLLGYYKNGTIVDTLEMLKKIIFYTKDVIYGFKKDIVNIIYEDEENKIYSYKDFNKYEAEAIKVIEYYKNFITDNNFINNIKTLAQEEYFDRFKYINIFKYIYKVYIEQTEHEELLKKAPNQESLNCNTFIIKDIYIDRCYIDYTYSYNGTNVKVYNILTNDGHALQLSTSSLKDFTLLKNKKCTCKIKKEFLTAKLGKVTAITNLKEAKN